MTKTVSSMPWRSAASFSWKQLLIRCSSPDCSLRLKVQPAVRARYSGVNFRDRWYHDTLCLQEPVLDAVKRLLPSASSRRPRAHRLPLGLLLVKRGVITPEELREGLRMQRQAGSGNLGYWLQQITSLDEEQICSALGQQWGCPVFPLTRSFVPRVGDDAPPYPLLAAAKAIPVFTTQDGARCHIAFSERIDHRLLYAIEEILGCRTYPCVAKGSAVSYALEQFRKLTAGNEICFDTVRDPAEIAATICSYAAQLDVREVRLVSAGGHLWVSFFRKGVRRDLLFRMPSAPALPAGDPLSHEIKAFPEIADMRKDGVLGAAEPL